MLNNYDSMWSVVIVVLVGFAAMCYGFYRMGVVEGL